MTSEIEDTSDLLEEIPSDLRTPEQVAYCYMKGEVPTYKLLRDPFNLEEFSKYNQGIAIWRDNGTLTYVSPHGYDDSRLDRRTALSLQFGEKGFTLNIAGSTDDSVAETIAYFVSLERPTEENSCRRVSAFCQGRPHSIAQSECLIQILKASPSWRVKLDYMALNVERSVLVATQSHPINLTLSEWVLFEDGGTAFVDALEKRQSSFGSLTFEGMERISHENVKRLLHVDKFKQLSLPLLHNELALLPFSMQLDSLAYEISSSLLLKADSLNIISNKLALAVHHVVETFPLEPMLSLLQRVADLGHFVKLKFGLRIDHDNMDTPLMAPDSVVEGLIRAALANSNLEVLDLSDYFGDCLKDHKALRRFQADVDDDAFGPDFIHLWQFLSHNRNITVTDGQEIVYSGGSRIDELYSLNRFYRGSAGLVELPPSERSLLVATALMKTVSDDLQRSALLLSDHMDVLYEWVQFAPLDDELDDDDDDDFSFSSDQGQKRRRRMF